ARFHGISRTAVTADAVLDWPRAPAAVIHKLVFFNVHGYVRIVTVAVILKVEIDSVQKVVVARVHRLLAGLVATLCTGIAPAGLRRGPVVRLARLEKFGIVEFETLEAAINI